MDHGLSPSIKVFGLGLLALLGANCATPAVVAFGGRYQSTKVEATISETSVTDSTILKVEARFPGLSAEEIKGIRSQVRFDKIKFPLRPIEENGKIFLRGYLGIPYLYDPGEHTATLDLHGPGVRSRIEFPLSIREGDYGMGRLRVDPSRVEIPEDVIPRLKEERAEVKEIYVSTSVFEWWEKPFILPVKSRITSPYGTKRTFNGQLKSYHSGLDLRAPTGKAIRAPAKGKVVLVKNLYFSGNTVLLDHGLGVVTLYGHMSRFRVKLGDEVIPGQVLGLSGSTGRVTGPHLHWGAIINGVKVNPQELLRVLE